MKTNSRKQIGTCRKHAGIDLKKLPALFRIIQETKLKIQVVTDYYAKNKVNVMSPYP